MIILPIYSTNIENFCIYGAIGYFVIFLIFIIVRKTAASQDSYTSVNIIHTRFLLAYLFSLTSIAIFLGEFNFKFFISITAGTFIYLSLHYVFVLALIGMCRKSISIRILAACHPIQNNSHTITLEKLIEYMHDHEFDIDTLRHSRLWQMTHLGFATRHNDIYFITFFGRLVDLIGSIVLKIYGLKRL